MSLQYRKDVDGMRALAVLPVLFFHAGVDGFSGGYVGVDIFFVISGFLITGIIQKEVTEGTFSYIDFWERRARRLIAPIVIVTLATFVASMFVLMPEEMQSLSQSIAALSLFSSNIYFWLKSGYFAAPDDTIPLLHTWSLAVEEQFYLFFPYVLMLLVGRPLRTKALWILTIALGSLLLSVIWVQTDPDSAYYLLPSRAFELMTGALLALLRSELPRINRTTGDVLQVLAIMVIVMCSVSYSEHTHFPGMAALLPCLATVVLLATGDIRGSIVANVFTNRLSVGIGKLSYSLYLWHWPVIVLWKEWAQTSIRYFSTTETVGVIVVSFILATASYVAIENPIRRRVVFATRRSLFTATLVSMGLLLCAGVAGHFTNGYEFRLPERVRLAVANRADWTERQFDCGDHSPEQILREDLCEIGVDGSNTRYLLWGDSHAQSVLEVVSEVSEDTGVSMRFASQGGCLALTDNPDLVPAACAEFNSAMFSFVESSRPELIILAGRWSAYAAFDGSRTAAGDTMRKSFASGLERLRESGSRIVILEEVPYNRSFSINNFGLQVWKGANPEEQGLTTEEYQARSRSFLSFVEGLPFASDLRMLHTARYLCRGDLCPAYWGGTLYTDSSHLSRFGSQRLLPMFETVLSGSLVKGSVDIHDTDTSGLD